MVSGVGMLPQGLPTAKRPRVALDEVPFWKHHNSLVLSPFVRYFKVGSESAESGEGVEGDCLIVGNIVIIIIIIIFATMIPQHHHQHHHDVY